jgi:hypothetical protein
MSMSKEKPISLRESAAGERLIKIGRTYLEGQKHVALEELHSMNRLSFADVFYMLDKMGPNLSRGEQRLLLDLVTEVVILRQVEGKLDKHLLEGNIKHLIREFSRFGEFIYKVLEQINGTQHT